MVLPSSQQTADKEGIASQPASTTLSDCYGKHRYLQQHGDESLNLQDLGALLHEQVVKLEAQLQEFATLQGCVCARHGHNLGLLSHQVVHPVCLALHKHKSATDPGPRSCAGSTWRWRHHLTSRRRRNSPILLPEKAHKDICSPFHRGSMQAAVGHLEQLKGAALLQLLEHGAQVAPAAPRALHVFLKSIAAEQHPRSVRKVLLEGEVVLQHNTDSHILRLPALSLLCQHGKEMPCPVQSLQMSAQSRAIP